MNGTYVVCLSITTTDNCTSTYCDTVPVNCIQPVTCQAAYQYTLGNCPNVSFFDGSSSSPGTISSWSWDFGDGSTTSSLQNPSHTYSANGTYVVCLSITTTDNCTSTYCDTVPISCIQTPGWTYTNTGVNHTILVGDTIPMTIDGVQISSGDYIGAFYDSLGTLACAGYILWLGVDNAVTAWGADLGNDGFATGEDFKWKIWDASALTEYDAVATYMPNPPMPNAGFFAANGLSGLASLTVSQSQVLTLPTGWSMWSTYMNATNPLMDSLFSSVVSEVIIVKNGNGQVYWPSVPLNMIGNNVIGEGYQIKMNSAQTVTISGTPVVPELLVINVVSGWSILGYLRQAPASIETMLSSLNPNIIIVKNGNGLVYWPSVPLNMIGNMNPGEGYQIKMSVSGTLTYPANSSVSKLSVSPEQPSYYKHPSATGQNMTIGIPDYAWDTEIWEGDEIGAFNEEGELVGSTVYDGEWSAIAVWGMDELTLKGSGCDIDEMLSFKLYRKFDDSEIDLQVSSWISGDGSYAKNDIQIIGRIYGDEHLSDGFRLNQNMPNPFSGQTIVSFYLPHATSLSLVVYDVLGNKVRELATGLFEAGKHEIVFNTEILAKGNYMYRLTADEYTATKQMSIAR